MARVPYVDPEELPADRRALLDTLSDADPDDREHSLRGGTLNVYRAMANDDDLLEAFRAYGGALWRESGLAPREREFVILTTARAAGSAYEWHQHVRVALDEGLSPEAIRAVAAGDDDALDPAHAALVAYARRFVDGRVDDGVHDRLLTHYDGEAVVGIGLLAGLYLGLARLIDALGVGLDGEFVGWELENL